MGSVAAKSDVAIIEASHVAHPVVVVGDTRAEDGRRVVYYTFTIESARDFARASAKGKYPAIYQQTPKGWEFVATEAP